MILKQYYLNCLAHASYLIGDLSSGTAVVVDPQRDVEHYLRDAKALGATIRQVWLTHPHADFVAGHLELAQATGKTWVYTVQLLMRKGPQKLAVGVRDDVAAAASFAVRTLNVG